MHNIALKITKEKLIKENFKLLFLSPAGSRLYGTHTKDSDFDYRGVFIPSKDYIFGLKNIEEIDISNKEKKLDIKLYELKKFVKLAIQNNPNIIELLFTKENAIYRHSDFLKLENIAKDFINQQIFKRFFGYANAQLKKGRIKAENFNNLLFWKEKLENIENKNILIIELYHTEKQLKNFFTKDKKHVKIGNRHFPVNINIKKFLKYLNDIIISSSKRSKEWKIYKYDSKFFLHLFRLLDEGKTLAINRDITFPLKNKKFYLDIRNHKFSLDEIEKLIENKINEFKKIEDKILNKLPKTANVKKIEKNVIEIYQNHFC